MDRRSFLFGLGSSLVAAPAVVRATSLMPIRGIVQAVDYEALAVEAGIYAELASITRKAFIPRLFIQVYQSPPLYQLPRDFWA